MTFMLYITYFLEYLKTVGYSLGIQSPSTNMNSTSWKLGGIVSLNSIFLHPKQNNPLKEDKHISN